MHRTGLQQVPQPLHRCALILMPSPVAVLMAPVHSSRRSWNKRSRGPDNGRHNSTHHYNRRANHTATA